MKTVFNTKNVFFTFLLSYVLASAGVAQAQILIGQTAGFTGAAASNVKEITQGAMLLIDNVNANGGINGQQIKLIQQDDVFDAVKAATNAKDLIENKNVLALFLTRGTSHNEAILPFLERSQTPLIAPSTGAMVLHSPVKKYVFNVRPTYQIETKRMVQEMAKMGNKKIGVVLVDDTFGDDAIVGLMQGFDAAQLKPAFVAKFDKVKLNFAAVLEQVKSQQPDAIVYIGSGDVVFTGVDAIRKTGWNGMFATTSNNASAGFVKSLKQHSTGMMMMQVFPNERNYSTAFVAEAAKLAKDTPISPAMLEGFAAAKVLVQALRNTGPNPTRAKLHATLEKLSMDLGGMKLAYSPQNHSGLSFADLSIIGKDGSFKR